uniref:Uncharacterized protein n=1 Tax=Anopheles merus TaxID=30066 RepID=A0A182VMF7_ANOME
MNEDVDNGEEIGPKDNGSDNDLIDLIDFSSDQEEPAAEPNETPVQKTLAKESNGLLEATPRETQIGPVSGSGRVKKVTFLLDDDPFRHYDSDNGSDSVKHPRGESDLPDSEVSEEEEEEEGEETARINGEVLDIDTESVCEQWVSVDESDPTSSGRKGSLVKHDPHDGGLSVKGRPEASDDGSSSSSSSSCDERGVVTLSNVKLSSVPIDERLQHAGSDIEVCCIDGRDLQTHHEHDNRGQGVQRVVTPANARQWPVVSDGRVSATSQRWNSSAGERERIDERCYVDDGGEGQHQQRPESTSLLRGLECVSASSLPWQAVGPSGEDEEEGKRRFIGLGQQRQLAPNGAVARTVQTCPTECEEKSTQVSAKGHGARTTGPLSSDSESENYYGTCSPPTEEGVSQHRPCANQHEYHPEGRECPSCPQHNSTSSSLLVEVTLSAHICVHHQQQQQQQAPFSFGETSNSCHCSENSRVLRDSATSTQDREGDDDSDGSSSRTGDIQSRTGHRNNPSSADSGIIIIDDDVDGGAASDERSFPCQQRVGDEQGGVSIVKGPGERRDQHQGTQTGPFVEQFIDSEIRPQGLLDHGPEQEVCEGVSVGERVQSDSRSKCSSIVSVSIEGYHPAQDDTSDRASGEAADAPSGGIECFEASQRLKRLEERFRGFAYTKKLFRESLSHDTPGLGAGGARRYGEAPRSVGGSLPSLLVCAGHPDARSSSTDYANTNTLAAGSPSLRASAEDAARGHGGSDANVTLLRSPTHQRSRRGLLSSASTSSLGSSSSSPRGFGAVVASSAACSASESSERKSASSGRGSSALLVSRKTSSLSCLQQDATRDEDDTESYLLSNSKSHGSNRAPHATSQPSPSTSLNRTARASWTRPILPPLSSSLLSLSASSLLSLSCLDLARQSRQRTASQEPSCTNREGEIAEGHGEGQEKNNNSRAEENGLSKAVSLPSLLAPVTQQQEPSECIVETVRGSAADTVSPARCASTAETIPVDSRSQLLRYQRQPRAVEELRRNTDTPESSGAESEEICKIFPGGKARVADPLEVVETVVIGGSTEEEDNDDDEEDEEEEDDDDEEDTSGHIVLSGVGEDILNNNHRHYLGGEEADTVRGDEFGRLEKLLAADPYTNCEFDTRHLQDYEPEVYRIKYCYDELEEELEEQQERAAANDLLVVLRGPARPLPVGPPPAVPPPPPPPPKGVRVVSVGDRQSAIYSTPRFGATVSGAEVQCSGAEGRAVGTRGEASAATVLPVSLARIADADSSEPGSASVVVVNGPTSVTGGSASGSVKTGEAEDRDIPPPPPPPKARAGVARSFDGCGCVIEAIPLYRSEAEAFAASGGAMRETATGTLRGLLKKPNRPPPVRKNRVVFDETRNEFFEADYIILIREDCPYDEEDEEPCTCGEHELVRICCDEGCNCGYTDDGRTPPPAVIA